MLRISHVIILLAIIPLTSSCGKREPLDTAHATAQQDKGKSYKDYKIAFAYQVKDGSRRLQTSDICVVNYDGSGFTNLTNGSIKGHWPRWSPDRKQIIFFSRATSEDKKAKWH